MQAAKRNGVKFTTNDKTTKLDPFNGWQIIKFRPLIVRPVTAPRRGGASQRLNPAVLTYG